MENPAPTYYAIIPAPVRYNKNIEAHAKLLYGEITALANVHGFCWATNKYFSELYGVDERTIKRWIESLKKEKLVKVEVIKNGIKIERRIWITPEIQKMFTKGQNCPGGGDKNVPHNNKDEYTKKKYIKRKTKEAAPPITYNAQTRKLEGITDEDLKEWQRVFTSVNIRKEIDRCTIWAYDNGRQNYRKSLMSFFKNTEKSHTEPFKPSTEPSKEATDQDVQMNRDMALEIEKRASRANIGTHYAVQANSLKVEFIMPNNSSYEINYHLPHEEFAKKCHPALKRMKL